MLLPKPTHLLTTLLNRKQETKYIWKSSKNSSTTQRLCNPSVCIHYRILYFIYQQQRNKNIEDAEFLSVWNILTLLC